MKNYKEKIAWDRPDKAITKRGIQRKQVGYRQYWSVFKNLKVSIRIKSLEEDWQGNRGVPELYCLEGWFRPKGEILVWWVARVGNSRTVISHHSFGALVTERPGGKFFLHILRLGSLDCGLDKEPQWLRDKWLYKFDSSIIKTM